MTKLDELLAWANMELGKPYVYGDEGPNSFDCSGLMQFIYGKVGISLPRTAAQQQDWAKSVAKPLPGDLVFWGDPAYHVALYIGNGKIIAAPQPGDKVKIQPVWGTPSGYGRVSGLGTATAPYVDTVTGIASTVGDTATGWLGSIRSTALEWLAVGFGAALVGYGLYRTFKPQIGAAWQQAKGVVGV